MKARRKYEACFGVLLIVTLSGGTLLAAWDILQPIENDIFIDSATIATNGTADASATAGIKLKYELSPATWLIADSANAAVNSEEEWDHEFEPDDEWPTPNSPGKTKYKVELFDGSTLKKTVNIEVVVPE